eukprot:UN04109
MEKLHFCGHHLLEFTRPYTILSHCFFVFSISLLFQSISMLYALGTVLEKIVSPMVYMSMFISGGIVSSLVRWMYDRWNLSRNEPEFGTSIADTISFRGISGNMHCLIVFVVMYASTEKT